VLISCIEKRVAPAQIHVIVFRRNLHEKQSLQIIRSSVPQDEKTKKSEQSLAFHITDKETSFLNGVMQLENMESKTKQVICERVLERIGLKTSYTIPIDSLSQGLLGVLTIHCKSNDAIDSNSLDFLESYNRLLTLALELAQINEFDEHDATVFQEQPSEKSDAHTFIDN